MIITIYAVVFINAHVLLYSHEVKVYQEWTVKVEDVYKTNLEKPLLIRNEQTSQLKVNFDPEVRK